MTLNQIYIKAKYDPEDGWTFDETKLGEKHGRTLIDKLKWVRQIGGNNLNIEPEFQSLSDLKELRNHFNHFDPPSMVITLEEAGIWMNQVIDIGLILLKIRHALNLHISTSLVDFLLQSEVIFTPENAFKKRLPLDSNEFGYHSSTW